MSAGTVTLPITEFAELQERVRVAEVAASEAKARVLELEASGLVPDERVSALQAAFTNARAIVQFAVGNLDPRTVKGWPGSDLAQLALLLPTLPGHTSQLFIEMASEFRNFVREIEDAERIRATRVGVAPTISDFSSFPRRPVIVVGEPKKRRTRAKKKR